MPRTKRNRRPLTVVGGGLPPLVDWQVFLTADAGITVLCEQPVFLTGEPAFFYTNDTEDNLGVSQLDQYTLETSFADSVNLGSTITLGAYDPGVRTAQGGYLVPGSKQAQATPPPSQAAEVRAPTPDAAQAPGAVPGPAPGAPLPLPTSPQDGVSAPEKVETAEPAAEPEKRPDAATGPKRSSFGRKERTQARRERKKG